LNITRGCEVQAIPFSELQDALASGQGDAIIAGLAANTQTRARFLFTRSYFQFPARFVTRKEKAENFWSNGSLSEKRIGVISGSAHEKMFRAFFPQANTVIYDRSEWMFGDLQNGNLDGIFHDGMRLAFWLGGSDSQKCCVFSGGAYFATDYLGSGLAIAVRKNQRNLADALNYALKTLEENGKTSELYLRYFPVGFY
jgi:polar amino acid transport system substrate-binding protein